MSLVTLWKSNPESFANYLGRQIVAFAGNGELRDNSDCSEQLREFLSLVPFERLSIYAKECLDQSFTDSGFFLQDVVNELGRRLEFQVLNGRYRGVTNAVGFDGLWQIPGGPTILVEVKTTDTYNVSLDAVAGYRKKLLANEEIGPESSILFVVGRKETGSLEAQIRGSRYAWDMRVVGVESLLNLVRVKEKSSEDQTVNQIRELLRPFEYTRVDRILDVVFSAALDVVAESNDSLIQDEQAEETNATEVPHERTPQNTIDTIRERAADAVSKRHSINLVRQRQALYADPNSGARACITISKRYSSDLQPYWYAFHPKWDQYLSQTDKGFMVFGCVDRSDAYAVPIDEMRKILPSLNQTVRPEGGMYWHVKLSDSQGKMVIFASKTGERFDLESYRVIL